jgi:hypothetical protein
LPPAREFVTSAGFGGAAALLAALLLAAVALFALRRASKRHRLQLDQQERHNQLLRDAEQHNAAVQRCWQRLVWVVETAALEPASSQGATVGLGPDLALELLRGLLRDAEDLGDATLTGAVSVHLNQFSLVLAHQGSVSSEPTAPASPDPATTDGQPGKDAPPEPSASPARTSAAPTKVAAAGGGRRRRQ